MEKNEVFCSRRDGVPVETVAKWWVQFCEAELTNQAAPTGVVLESSDEDTEDDYLANSQTQRKIAELAAKRNNKMQTATGGIPMAENGIVQPLSPTTRRRGIIMKEMSESLRHSSYS